MARFIELSNAPPADSSVFTTSSSEALTSTNSRGCSQGRLIWCVGAIACRRQQEQVARSRAFDVLVDINLFFNRSLLVRNGGILEATR